MTLTKQHAVAVGDLWELVVHVAWDSSYPTDGEALAASDLGMTEIVYVSSEVAAVDSGTTAVVVKYDYANSKLQAFETGAALSGNLAESGNTESLANFESVHRILCKGPTPVV